MEDDGFVLVSKKKSARRKNIKRLINADTNNEEDLESSLHKIEKIRKTLLNETLVNNFLNIVKHELKSENLASKKLYSVVCYGLGKVGSCQIAQAQFAFLLIVKELFQVDVFAYDPKFSPIDKKLLDYFNIKVIAENEKGKRKVNNDERILFFMPHCDMFLYNNLLWANWNFATLRDIIIIGNSFQNIVKDHISRHLDSKYKYILLAEQLSFEKEFPKINETLFEAFNNISLIAFSKMDDGQINNKELWNYLSEPFYSDDELC